MRASIDAPVNSEWRLVEASARPEGYPLIYLRFVRANGERAVSRFDLDKQRFIDPLPEAIRISSDKLQGLAVYLREELASAGAPQAHRKPPDVWTPLFSDVAPKAPGNGIDTEIDAPTSGHARERSG